MTAQGPLLLTIVSGFLGSGKTTLLRRALSDGEGAGIAVVVNEFAGIGLDHELMAGLGDACIALTGGCACCERRRELLDILHRLLDQRERGAMGDLRRVVIETSGLADPGPIATSIATDSVLRHHFDLQAIVAVVDGLNWEEQIERHPEVKRQIEIADRILISKTDLVDPDEVARLERRVAGLNLAAIVSTVDSGWQNLFDRESRRRTAAVAPAVHAHSESMTCTSLTFDEPVNWVAFGVWLSMLLHAHGRNVLRVKGIVPVAGVGQVAINTVQHFVYPPEHIGPSSRGAKASLVLISHDLATEAIERSMRVFQQIA